MFGAVPPIIDGVTCFCSLAALDAFNKIRLWVKGFIKNSRSRPRGVDIFVEPAEREELQEIEVGLRNLCPDLPALGLP